jgi:hypothetical protein
LLRTLSIHLVISRDSLANLELQRRRVPDCESLFLGRALAVGTEDLFPKGIALKEVGPKFQSGDKLAVFQTRSEK